MTKLLDGDSFDFNCHSNLTRAVLPYHLNESDVHDVLNIFQVTGLNDGGSVLHEGQPLRRLETISSSWPRSIACASRPARGDLSIPMWGPDAADPLPTCKPIGIEVYDVPKQLLGAGTRQRLRDYTGFFGLKQPVWGEEN